MKKIMCLGYSRDQKIADRTVITRRHLNRYVNAICCSRRDTNQTYIAEYEAVDRWKQP